MSTLTLTRDFRLELQARAHHLQPVVLLGNQGLSAAALKEIDRALSAHGLIKVRVPGDAREERTAAFADIADRLNAAAVQMIGKVLVFYRPIPDEAAKAKADTSAKKVSAEKAAGAKKTGRATVTKSSAKPRTARTAKPVKARHYS